MIFQSRVLFCDCFMCLILKDSSARDFPPSERNEKCRELRIFDGWNLVGESAPSLLTSPSATPRGSSISPDRDRAHPRLSSGARPARLTERSSRSRQKIVVPTLQLVNSPPNDAEHPHVEMADMAAYKKMKVQVSARTTRKKTRARSRRGVIPDRPASEAPGCPVPRPRIRQPARICRARRDLAGPRRRSHAETPPSRDPRNTTPDDRPPHPRPRSFPGTPRRV